MAILTPPPTPAPQRGDRTTFAARVDAFITWLINFVTEMVNLVAGLNTLAAGGAYSIAYVFDGASTADADPGSGKLRLSNLTQNAATVLRVDVANAAGQDVTSILDRFDASTSTVKGSIRLQKMGDPSKWLTFDVTARAAPSGYRNLTVANTGGSAANPFQDGDSIMLFFQYTGDKGDLGPQPTNYLMKLGEAVVSAQVVTIDFLNIFSSAYDRYTIEIEGVKTTATVSLYLRVATGGVVDSGAAAYLSMVASNNTPPAGTNSALTLAGTDTANATTLTVHVRNANSSLLKSIGCYGWDGPKKFIVAAEGAYPGASVLTGFQLFPGSGAFTTGTVRVYGHKNS